MIAALYVETDGAYIGLPGVDAWDEPRDARKYAGPHPIVAHPPCQRWGRFWHGSTRKPHQFKLGDDGGCFAHALETLERCGGVLEHPCDSHAWAAFGLTKPPRTGGWVPAGRPGMWTCCVYQGHYGHLAGKPTWLLAKSSREALPELRWGKVEQRLHPVALARHGYAKARRIGMMAMVGGKDKTRIRNATPEPFRDLLVQIARSVPTSSACRAPSAEHQRPATPVVPTTGQPRAAWPHPSPSTRAASQAGRQAPPAGIDAHSLHSVQEGDSRIGRQQAGNRHDGGAGSVRVRDAHDLNLPSLHVRGDGLVAQAGACSQSGPLEVEEAGRKVCGVHVQIIAQDAPITSAFCREDTPLPTHPQQENSNG